MTNRAKRMIKYLEENLDWDIMQDKAECPKGHFRNIRGKYCIECGSKMKQIKDIDSVNQVEEAIKFALNESV